MLQLFTGDHGNTRRGIVQRLLITGSGNHHIVKLGAVLGGLLGMNSRSNAERDGTGEGGASKAWHGDPLI
ncbi:hypothetical protein GCM10011382_18120 [Vreelandella lutescens]|uniref:Uncharacterized protein n=1 Tax=Vreelandella lutescens TaxID=1602943 RepID=A0ABQ1P2Y5_9GAMM|nr:hypothetical protein GCM10011382_18120 [Halomonas lutescens]